MNANKDNINLIDSLIINIPAFLFIIGAVASLLLFNFSKKIPNFVFLILAWWCLSGSIMLFIDFKRKREKFLRLLNLQKKIKINYPSNLKNTICGLCLILALKIRVRTIKNSGGTNE